jgi:hypothetical protein
MDIRNEELISLIVNSKLISPELKMSLWGNSDRLINKKKQK